MPGKIRGKIHTRTLDKIHLIVRMELANPLLNALDIAKLVGLKPTRYSILKMSTIYRQVHNQYLSGVLSSLDVQVKETLNMTQETLKFAVPVAMQALLKQALQEKDLRVQNKACNDILDRDGHFAKVTRIGMATEEQGGVANKKDNEIAGALVEALRNIQKPGAVTVDSPSITDTTQ